MKKPFQGAHPSEARFVFFGLDANFDEYIDNKPYLEEVLRYLDDGVTYWRNEGVHHPFLSSKIKYTGSGKKYHERFSKIGFKQNHAEHISFIELLDIPTFGTSNFEYSDLNDNHINKIIEWVFYGKSEYIFIPSSVAKLLKKRAEFKFLCKKPSELESINSIPLWHLLGNKYFLKNRHFTYISNSQCKYIGSFLED